MKPRNDPGQNVYFDNDAMNLKIHNYSFQLFQNIYDDIAMAKGSASGTKKCPEPFLAETVRRDDKQSLSASASCLCTYLCQPDRNSLSSNVYRSYSENKPQWYHRQ